MNNSKIFILLIPILILIGCVVTKVDLITDFMIDGIICNKATSAPVSDARLLFIDKGFDSSRSKMDNSIEIGISDKHGKIRKDVRYFWGYDDTWCHEKPSEIFEIVISKDGYKDKRVSFKKSELEVISGKVIVPLGEVYLEIK